MTQNYLACSTLVGEVARTVVRARDDAVGSDKPQSSVRVYIGASTAGCSV